MKYEKIKSAFPEFWYVVADDTNYEELEEIRKELFQPDENLNIHMYFELDCEYILPGYSLVSMHAEDDSYYYTFDLATSNNTWYDKYELLTFEELISILESVNNLPESNSNTIFSNYYDII